jgi:hypothetical protein
MKQGFKFKAVLARTTTDRMKSKLLSKQLVELVLDCYMHPDEFARLVKEKFEKEMIVEIK